MPLTSWTCDTCGGQITDTNLGLVTWIEDEQGRAHSFLVVHKNYDGYNCDPGFEKGYSSSVGISSFLGAGGQAWLLSMLSLGPLKGASELRPGVLDFDEYVDLFRRMQTPWYEEARSHWGDEEVRHWLDDANEMYPYQPEVLERIATESLGR